MESGRVHVKNLKRGKGYIIREMWTKTVEFVHKTENSENFYSTYNDHIKKKKKKKKCLGQPDICQAANQNGEAFYIGRTGK